MNKNLPIFIIVIVLIAAVIGGIVLFRSPSTPPSNANVPSGNKPNDFKNKLAKAPPGASPAQSKGDPAAKVTIEEFADFSCPTCASFHQKIKEIEKTYGQKVRIIYRHYPLQIKGHENSYNAARAAEAAGLQGRFWEMQNLLFTNRDTWTVQAEGAALDTFAGYAKTVGIDVDKFKEEMLNSQIVSARVAADMARGKAIDINGTPTVIINGDHQLTFQEISNVDALRQAIESEMQKGAPAQSNSNANANQ
jgi:protein-disulfide isomerase